MAKRKLNLRARAERMDVTRQRIVHAAFDLHRTIGPARTTISAIAREAGVQRHTVYQHFPDELQLSAACTRHGLSLDPQPDPAWFARVKDPEDRLLAALRAQYGYYERNRSLLENVYRDAPLMQEQLQEHGLTWESVPEVVRSYFEQPMVLAHVLTQGWPGQSDADSHLHAAVRLAVDFSTWRTLIVSSDLQVDDAINLMVGFVRSVSP